MAKSYYAILGISAMADAEEIKTAYRRLAKVYHPDHYAGSSDIFRQVQEAYDVLGNAERRRQYERRVHKIPVARSSPAPERYAKPEPLIPEDRSMPMHDIRPMRASQIMPPSHDAVFDWMWANFSTLLPPSFNRIRTMTIEVTIDPEHARRGGTVSILVPARASCPLCRGHGSIGVYECSRCAGEGVITGDMPVAIAFPPGINDNDAMVMPLSRYGMRDCHLTIIFQVRL